MTASTLRIESSGQRDRGSNCSRRITLENPGLQRDGELVPAGKKGKERVWCDDALTFIAKDPKYQNYFPKGSYSTDAFTDKAMKEQLRR